MAERRYHTICDWLCGPGSLLNHYRPELYPQGYADRLAKCGYNLILMARSQENLSEVAARLKFTGRRIETIAADLTKAEDVRSIAERLRTDTTITALNNAGLGSAGKLLDSKIDDLKSMIYLYVTALTRLALAALPGLWHARKVC